ncbi:metal ABC transporter substrate-binding protein, partial [Lactiplantibacillus plantarum]|nr:metal ABC transporter substrate-binding protein [Lactiplantibacillus plantarum]
ILRLASLLTSAEVAGFISERYRGSVFHGRRA